MLDRKCASRNFSFVDIFNNIKYRYNFKKDHPDYFYPCGLVCFYGPQGSGKTLSAVNYVLNLKKKYPKCLLITNVDLKPYPFNDEDVFYFKNADDLINYSNGEKGVIFLIDEIQLYFNSLESKNISMDIINLVSQQRKQRITIVSTSQVFGRMAKPLREQFDSAIECNCYFGFLQINHLIKRDISTEDSSVDKPVRKFSKHFIFTHPLYLYNSYDTSLVIKRGNFKSKGESNIYGLNLPASY